MTDRISCCVPFCRRTISREVLTSSANIDGYAPMEWICADHWRATGNSARKAYAARKRSIRRKFTFLKLRKLSNMWGILKKQAIERATGI